MSNETRSHPFGQRRLSTFDYANPDHAFFVTICARAGTQPFTDARIAQEVIDSLFWLRQHARLTIYAYCLMPDHLHLLLRLGNERESLGLVLKRMKSFTSRQCKLLGYDGTLWQSRFYDHILRKSEAGKRIVNYILANPERKGLVTETDGYPWSGTPDPL